MELAYIVLEIVLVFLLGLFIKNYFPAYMEEKGKNLATKEDIEDITRKTEEVQREFKEAYDLFSSDLHFKYEFYFKQYSELYSELYSYIVQSEYIRQFLRLNGNAVPDFYDAPFIEVSTSPQRIQNEEKVQGFHLIASFNKLDLCKLIIENGEYASQKLLKIAVSYRFAHQLFSGNDDGMSSLSTDIADDQELELLREMVRCIVSEYNCLRKELKMDYCEKELDSGVPQIKVKYTDTTQ